MGIDFIKWLLAFVVAVLLACISYETGYNRASQRTPEVVVDTLVVRDTITQYEAVVEERRVVEKVFLPVTDTLRLRDTLYIEVEREQLVWRDSLTDIYVSGVMPRVDSVRHYVTERVVTMTETRTIRQKCRWGVGINVGYGIGMQNSSLVASPYVGVGLSYNLLSF